MRAMTVMLFFPLIWVKLLLVKSPQTLMITLFSLLLLTEI